MGQLANTVCYIPCVYIKLFDMIDAAAFLTFIDKHPVNYKNVLGNNKTLKMFWPSMCNLTQRRLRHTHMYYHSHSTSDSG